MQILCCILWCYYFYSFISFYTLSLFWMFIFNCFLSLLHSFIIPRYTCVYFFLYCFLSKVRFLIQFNLVACVCCVRYKYSISKFKHTLVINVVEIVYFYNKRRLQYQHYIVKHFWPQQLFIWHRHHWCWVNQKKKFLLFNCGFSGSYNTCYKHCLTAYSMCFRVGLVGNPSDGFNGKTISLSIKNFWAEVSIYESAELVSFIFPSPSSSSSSVLTSHIDKPF